MKPSQKRAEQEAGEKPNLSKTYEPLDQIMLKTLLLNFLVLCGNKLQFSHPTSYLVFG